MPQIPDLALLLQANRGRDGFFQHDIRRHEFDVMKEKQVHVIGMKPGQALFDA